MPGNGKTEAAALKLDRIVPLRFRLHQKPQVSMIIPVWNNWSYSYRCLQSILENTEEVPYEIIVIDNGSTDETMEMLQKVENIKIIRNESNLGYIQACNGGGKNAQGNYLLFLNNDTTVTKGWLKAMIALPEADKTIGAVGAKLILPDGALQEAGCIVWSDGSVLQYGRGEDPGHPEFCYLREVDYCSGACLLVRKDIFFNIGGFDEIYSPAYYEDSDLCFEIRRLGYRVVYHPEVQIIHHEFGSSSNEKALSLYETNMDKFRGKWRDALKDQFPPYEENIFLARDRRKGRRLFVLDDGIPPADLQELHRMPVISRCLAEAGYVMTFLSLSDPMGRRFPIRELQLLGIEVIDGGHLNIEEFLETRTGLYDSIFLSGSLHAVTRVQSLKRVFPDALILWDAGSTDRGELDESERSDILLTQVGEKGPLNLVDAILVSSQAEEKKLTEIGFKHVFTWKDPLAGEAFGFDSELIKLRLVGFLRRELNREPKRRTDSRALETKGEYIIALNAKISTMEAYIRSLKEAIREKDKQLAALYVDIRARLKESDQYVANLTEAIDGKDQQLSAARADIQSILKEKDHYIKSLREAIKDKDSEFSKLQTDIESIIRVKDSYVGSLVQTLKNKEEHILNLTTLISELHSIKNKRAYRLLRRLRFV